MAHTLTAQEGDDPSQVASLLAADPGEIGRFIGDGAYAGAPTYQTVAQHSAAAQIVIPPRSTAVRGCRHAPLMPSKPKRPSAWRCSTACWLPHARSPSAVRFKQHSPQGNGHVQSNLASM
ncbi:hypothetical protein AYM40_08530 [Paraburkholderia phytofirmans OLGA172]|uniref:Uncharacterized protein n=1 Tax=Paraburkholderia phytofirmans OLGA172 TaxID=1417228 RepID=A0A160FJ96_9BURK|nr:hypothetical protein AYM40_08530 [Paraburkholderia phytofirmans OLGA172]